MPAPKKIGPWIIDRTLGQGGFGSVFAAHHEERPEVTRALKWVVSGAPAAIERARREAEVLARLSHPGIVRIYDLGVEDGGLYLVLDLVEGESLRQFIARNPAGLPLSEACRLTGAMAQAVGAAHKAGVVHRDLKPENVLRTPEGEIRVLDFGLALEQGADRLTRTGTTLGTLGYMAPEQLDGQRALQGPASDVYALGAIFFELATGHPLIAEGTAAAKFLASASREFTLPSAVRADLSSDVDAFVLKAIAAEPRHRFPDGEAFAQALVQLARREGEAKRAVGASRSRLRAGITAATVAFALAWIAGAAWFAWPALVVGGATVTHLQERVDRELAEEQPTPEHAAALAAERAGFPSWKSHDTAVKLEALDRSLELLARRADLVATSDDRVLAAAHELATSPQRPAVAARLLEILFKKEKDPVRLRHAVELLCKDAHTSAARTALAEVLVPNALREPATRRHAALVSVRADVGDSFDAVASKIATTLAAPTPAAPTAATPTAATPTPTEARARDEAIDTIEALAAAIPSSRPERREIGRAAARLFLARASERRRTDPPGVIRDRLAAFEFAPDEPSPPWYPGYLSRRAVVLYEATSQDTAKDELAELLAVYVEAQVEDAGWGWDFKHDTSLGELIRLSDHSPAGRLAISNAALLRHDFPFANAADGDSTPARFWRSYSPRLRPLAVALARRTPDLPNAELAGAGAVDLDSPRDATAAIWRTVYEEQQGWTAAADADSRTAIENAQAHVTALAAAHAAAPDDPDVERTWFLARCRLANLLDFRASERAYRFTRAREGEAEGSPEERAAEIPVFTELLERAIAVAPTGFEYRRLCLHEHLVVFLHLFGHPRESFEAWQRAAADPEYVSLARNPAQDLSSVDKMIETIHVGALAGLELDPPRIAEAQHGLDLIGAIKSQGHPNNMGDYAASEAAISALLKKLQEAH